MTKKDGAESTAPSISIIVSEADCISSGSGSQTEPHRMRPAWLLTLSRSALLLVFGSLFYAKLRVASCLLRGCLLRSCRLVGCGKRFGFCSFLGAGEFIGADKATAFGLHLRFGFRPGDVDRHVHRDFRMQTQADIVQAEHLDRPVEHDLGPVDGGAAFGDCVADVAGAYRTIELPRIARLADHHDVRTVEPLGYRLGFRTPLQVVRFQLRSLLFEDSEILPVGAECLALRQEKVARKTWSHAHDIAHLSQILDALEQDHFHFLILLVT